MNRFVNRLKQQLNTLARHPEIGKIKSQTAKTIHRASIPIPLSGVLIQTALVQAQLEDVQKIKVTIDGGYLHIRGEVRKWMVKVPFTLALKPSEAHERTVAFLIHEMTPSLNERIKQHIFHRPPYLRYEEKQIFLDLNQIEVIRNFKQGTIKNLEINGDKLWVRIGI
ncbi:hypothetical protein [Ammoniphilus sp. YIM 78166]|uniref:hypothetical protein n=1 Tax=Ammoniphilus sp. YIM 78166 TaxID=1644106 RepID=UPI0010704C12|nr:hypothetical protein [Ammoniphilus sp. YIM 78166]